MDPLINKEDAAFYLGRYSFQKADYEDAIAIYKKGLKANPRSVPLLYETGLAFYKLKEYEKAIQYWGRLLEIAPYSLLAGEARWRSSRMGEETDLSQVDIYD